MIIDSKVLMLSPPPSYAAATASPSPSGGTGSPPPTLATLPPHILLHVVYATFPQTPSIDHGKIERQRKTLLWLVHYLRLVNRSFYIACMHVLRSTYLPAYQSLIRPPYTSDPFPTTTSYSRSPTYTESSSNNCVAAPQSIASIQRETRILDQFIALKVREDVFVDDSELHLEREDRFKDLFDHAQPKARLEDLVRRYGVREGVISVPGLTGNNTESGGGSAQQTQRGEGSASAKSSKVSPAQSTSNLLSSTQPVNNHIPLSPVRSAPSSPPVRSRFFNFFSSSRNTKPFVIPTPYPSSPTTPTLSPTQQPQIKSVPFLNISISLSPRTISLVFGSGADRQTLAQVQREGRDMKLEYGAKMLVNELKELLISEAE